jgi:hypothetical protein
MSILDHYGNEINDYIDKIISNYPSLGKIPCVSVYLLNKHEDYIIISVMYSANQMQECINNNSHFKNCKCRVINHEKFMIYNNQQISYYNKSDKLIYISDLGKLILDVVKKFNLFSS